MTSFPKQCIAIRYWMLGNQYHKAVEAMELAQSYHTGTRKDGITPEFHHQVRIASYLSTLRDVSDMEGTLCVAWLHDLLEDYEVTQGEIERRFGHEIGLSTWRVTKKFRGYHKDAKSFFTEMKDDCRASLVKGGDRLDNLQSMIGVFTPEKQEKYIHEAEEFFLPMLKLAAKNFPNQHLAYMNIRIRLKDQIALLKAKSQQV